MELGQTIVIQMPTTAVFSITHDLSAVANEANVSIYGLDRSTRELIFKDILNTGLYKPISIEMGYGSQLVTVFTGNIMYCYSEREYPTVVTKINAWDGGYDILNSSSSFTLRKNQTIGDIINKISKSWIYTNPGEIGAIAQEQTESSRGVVASGNNYDLLDKYTKGRFHIDDGKMNVLKDNEVLEGLVYIINSDTGLLGTPKRYDAYVEVDMLLEPRIQQQQVVEVNSSIQSAYNGQFKVVSVKHEATISQSVCGYAKTTLGLLNPSLISQPNQGFNVVKNNVVSPLNSNQPIDGDVNNVYNYLVKNGRPPQTLITSQISWNEALINFRSNNSFHGSNEMPTQQQLQNLKSTCVSLQSFVDTYYPGQSISIYSGWRSKIGTYHMSGQALDFSLSGASPYQVQQTLVKSGLQVGIGEAPQHTHYDTRGYRAVFSDSDN
jgi:hypothetical protein